MNSQQDMTDTKTELKKIIDDITVLSEDEIEKLKDILILFKTGSDYNCSQCDCPMVDTEVQCVVCGYDG
tara:strand:+ start:150 stop:356 length:207 start_codon:yes stop_codon:yes gene_type:complete